MFKSLPTRRFLAMAAIAAVAVATTVAIAQSAHRTSERLRTVRGTFDFNGNILAGAGFTVEIESSFPGDGSNEFRGYNIRFDRPFHALPTIVGTKKEMLGPVGLTAGSIVFGSVDQAQATIAPANAQPENTTLREFSFIVAGP